MRPPRFRPFAVLLLLALAAAAPEAPPQDQAAQDRAIAETLAAMLRAARSVISENQALINDPERGDKGLTGPVVLARSAAIFHTNTGIDPASIDPESREGRLLHAEMDAIATVVDANQATLNARGVGFKGFIPATFARLVGEEFTRRAHGEASILTSDIDDLRRIVQHTGRPATVVRI